MGRSLELLADLEAVLFRDHRLDEQPVLVQDVVRGAHGAGVEPCYDEYLARLLAGEDLEPSTTG